MAGISIGAVNAAIIAGNTAQNRLPRLREFWDAVSSGFQTSPFIRARWRELFNEINAATFATPACRGFSTPRFPSPLSPPAGSPEALSFYDTTPAERHADAARRFRPHQPESGVAPQRRRGQCRERQLRLLRQPRSSAWSRAHHGQRGAATGLAAGRHRRRVLLGRRPRLQHAAAVRARRRRAERRHARVPGRPVQRPRPHAAQYADVAAAREGHPLLQPDAPQYRCLRTAAAVAPRRRAPLGQAAEAPRDDEDLAFCASAGCSCRDHHRAPDQQGKPPTTGPEGLRVLARLHSRELGGRSRRRDGRPRPRRLAQAQASRPTASPCST